MNQKLSGVEFTDLIAETLGHSLKNAEFVAILFETCQLEGKSSTFKDLAFHAKSFQKIARLLTTDKVGEDAKLKARAELEGALKKFSGVLENVLSWLPKEKREAFHAEFLLPTPDSFLKLRGLLDDFARVKDFYLIERDKGSMS